MLRHNVSFVVAGTLEAPTRRLQNRANAGASVRASGPPRGRFVAGFWNGATAMLLPIRRANEEKLSAAIHDSGNSSAHDAEHTGTHTVCNQPMRRLRSFRTIRRGLYDF